MRTTRTGWLALAIATCRRSLDPPAERALEVDDLDDGLGAGDLRGGDERRDLWRLGLRDRDWGGNRGGSMGQQREGADRGADRRDHGEHAAEAGPQRARTDAHGQRVADRRRVGDQA